jgi:hypothetical protein
MLQGIDGWLKKRGWLKEGSALFSKLGSLVPGTVICSGASNQCLVKAGVLDEKFVYLSPDDTLDEATRLGWMVVCIDNKGEDYWRLSLPKKGGSNNGNCCKSTYC